MTPEQAACEMLLGEKLGSIRSIHYRSGPVDATATPDALEIETKTGRFVHVTATNGGVCRIAGGPVPTPMDVTASLVRQWTDLTTEVPFAFDGRPVVARVEPMRRAGKTCGWVIEFSNGGRLVYELTEGEPRLVCTPAC